MSTLHFQIANTPEQATTLPKTAYTNPEIYTTECEILFKREWWCIGHVSMLPNVGDYFTLDLLQQPLLIVRNSATEVQVLSNVCLHRAMPLETGNGNTKTFTCPYHKWVYELNGQLRAAPFMDAAQDFNAASCRLPEFRSEIWNGFIFMNFEANAPALGESLHGLNKRFSEYGAEDLILVDTLEYDSPWNWKILVENFIEAYHHIGPHSETFQPIYPAKASYAPDNDGPWALLCMPGNSESTETILPEIGHISDAYRHELVAGVVFPTFLFAMSSTIVTWYQIIPDRVDRFDLKIRLFVSPEIRKNPQADELMQGLSQMIHHIHTEDISVNDGVWRGMNAPATTIGRLSPLEKPVWQFHRLWQSRMAAKLTT